MKLPLLQVETERLIIRPFQNDDYESWLDGFNKRLHRSINMTMVIKLWHHQQKNGSRNG